MCIKKYNDTIVFGGMPMPAYHNRGRFRSPGLSIIIMHFGIANTRLFRNLFPSMCSFPKYFGSKSVCCVLERQFKAAFLYKHFKLLTACIWEIEFYMSCNMEKAARTHFRSSFFSTCLQHYFYILLCRLSTCSYSRFMGCFSWIAFQFQIKSV